MSLLHDQMYVGGLGLAAVARISNAAQGSMVSGHFISTLGSTRLRGNAQRAWEALEAEMPLNDFRPALSEMYRGVPGTTVASAPKKISSVRLDCHTHCERIPMNDRQFASNNIEQLV